MLSVQHVTVQNRLNNISVEMHSGECWHVLGQNGAGKTSLFELIAGLERADTGTVILNGREINELSIADIANKLAYLQQHFTLSFPLTVQETLEFYTGNHLVPKLIEQALSITPLLKRNLNNLSGGEQQRVHIARVLMQVWQGIEQGDILILLDEPIQSLDVVFQEKALALFRELATFGNLVVLSIHDVNLSISNCDHVLMIKNSRELRYGKAKTVMSAENISELYDYRFEELVNQHNSDKFFIRSPL
ncbi:ABC transporter ATP-binding protein [Glaciecola sp. MF2-115]|uniref:ABC transporter ATP-binding protein n=1 Tax=Glaciecola sp. MF2-115 TaxID=3384827 RepID=UPI0039A018FB